MKPQIVIALTAALWASAAGAAEPALHSPEQVKEALRILAYVQADMASKLPNKAYDRLPHENQEFQEAAPALTDAIAAEPAALRAQVAQRLAEARQKAQAVADASPAHDEARIAAAVAAVDKALASLDALFPEALRPVAGQLGGRPGKNARGGPPADVR